MWGLYRQHGWVMTLVDFVESRFVSAVIHSVGPVAFDDLDLENAHEASAG